MLSNIIYQQTQARKHPLNRSHQTNIALLLEELDDFGAKLQDQRHVVGQLFRVLEGPDTSEYHINPHLQVAQGCIEAIDSKLRSLEDLRGRAERLARSGREYIENNKDRQEAAVYVFTIVTIVFLPISTISSIFGMNTSDVRDMEQSQVSLTVVYNY